MFRFFISFLSLFLFFGCTANVSSLYKDQVNVELRTAKELYLYKTSIKRKGMVGFNHDVGYLLREIANGDNYWIIPEGTNLSITKVVDFEWGDGFSDRIFIGKMFVKEEGKYLLFNYEKDSRLPLPWH